MERILVVDDEPDIIELVGYNLKKAGYKVSEAADGEDALTAIKHTRFDLVILDLMLPGLHGVELCRIIRGNPRTAHLPVIMLTAKTDVDDRIGGLDAGADDYLTKPFSPKELLARVKAVLRRSGEKKPPDAAIRFGKLRIDTDRLTITKADKVIRLSATEFRLLLYLVERKGRIFSRDQLLDAVWKDEAFVEPRTVDVHIRRLRVQIEDDPAHPRHIRTRRGVGYYAEVE